MNTNGDFELLILTSEGRNESTQSPDDEVRLDSFIPSLSNFIRKVGPKEANSIERQWSRTLNSVLKLTASVQESIGDWEAESMEIGFTISAKGELLFIAEAGAEASIKLVLRPKAPKRTPSTSELDRISPVNDTIDEPT